jgi:hypothetical protein
VVAVVPVLWALTQHHLTVVPVVLVYRQISQGQALFMLLAVAVEVEALVVLGVRLVLAVQVVRMMWVVTLRLAEALVVVVGETLVRVEPVAWVLTVL